MQFEAIFLGAVIGGAIVLGFGKLLSITTRKEAAREAKRKAERDDTIRSGQEGAMRALLNARNGVSETEPGRNGCSLAGDRLTIFRSGVPHLLKDGSAQIIRNFVQSGDPGAAVSFLTKECDASFQEATSIVSIFVKQNQPKA